MAKLRRLLASLGLAALAMAAAGEAGVCLTLVGPDSAIRSPRVELVTAPQDWAALWLEHRGLPPRESYDFYYNLAGVPEVDFATHVVVAVFAGETSNCAGLRLDALVAAEGRTTLRYARKSYQTVETIDAVTPFGVFVLPRVPGALVVEEQLYSMTGPSRIEPRAELTVPG